MTSRMTFCRKLLLAALAGCAIYAAINLDLLNWYITDLFTWQG
jgi:hypothetical protein